MCCDQIDPQVYCFRTASGGEEGEEEGDGGVSSPGAAPASAVRRDAIAPASAAALRGGSGASSSSGAAALPSSAPATTGPQEARAGPVGSAQLVEAVRDLLGAAGLPLELSQAQLLERAAGASEALEQVRRVDVRVHDCSGGQVSRRRT